MNTLPITFGQLYPLLNKDQQFVLIDKNNVATSYEPSGNRTAEVYDLLGKRVLGIEAFKWDPYCEESYVAIRLDYNKQDALMI